jgi:hypothetical protein
MAATITSSGLALSDRKKLTKSATLMSLPFSFEWQFARSVAAIVRGGGTPSHRCPNSLQRYESSAPKGSVMSCWLGSNRSVSSGAEQSSSSVMSTMASSASSRKKPAFSGGIPSGSPPSARRTDSSWCSKPQPLVPSSAMHDSASEMLPSKFCLAPSALMKFPVFGAEVQVDSRARGRAWKIPRSPPGVLHPSTPTNGPAPRSDDRTPIWTLGTPSGRLSSSAMNTGKLRLMFACSSFIEPELSIMNTMSRSLFTDSSNTGRLRMPLPIGSGSGSSSCVRPHASAVVAASSSSDTAPARVPADGAALAVGVVAVGVVAAVEPLAFVKRSPCH